MRIYSRAAAAALKIGDDLCHPAEDGGFDLPEAQALDLLAFHADGNPLWETQDQRAQRLAAAETEHLRDPATLTRLMERAVAQTAVA
jgi:hypothetical protein